MDQQIGLWATIWKNCQKHKLSVPHYNKKLRKYTQNIEKSLILDSILGRMPWATPGIDYQPVNPKREELISIEKY
jgi:hypothetical protein